MIGTASDKEAIIFMACRFWTSVGGIRSGTMMTGILAFQAAWTPTFESSKTSASSGAVFIFASTFRYASGEGFRSTTSSPQQI